MPSEQPYGRGLTWSKSEIRCFLDIWSDDFIRTQLSTKHKNSGVFALFSERLLAKGFSRSVEQCRIKAKKLRQDYMRVRRALDETGGRGVDQKQLMWFDKLHKILGTKAVCDPVDVVESYENQPTPFVPADNTRPPSAGMSPVSEDTSVDGVESSNSSSTTEWTNTGTDEGVSGCSTGPTTAENTPQRLIPTRLPIPGAQARKRRAKSSSTDIDFREYMIACKKMMADMIAAEERHMAREEAAFERLLQAQREDSERTFQAMLAQQQATNQMFMHLIGILTRGISSSQQSSSATPASETASTSTPSPNASSTPQHKQGEEGLSYSCSQQIKEEFEAIDKLKTEAVSSCSFPDGRLQTDKTNHDKETESNLTMRTSVEEKSHQSVGSQAEDSSTHTHTIVIKDEPDPMD
ncbi:uncharacterized protein LOC115382778 [Salarias fasciatus]|uniref:uncharacterized protein LOC115382778 n=1 Tax=Salarias fasciatus TaxID=181472 RepID=UPI0011767E85|nr:uncharacterized protein LOC115382778 [Salarias fasciatus]